ncbi:MAG: segregation/condensation protein A [Lachnospiraceae bacterium]|nr:segregation/condensation protein A [Lachnospiraceae bacterium]
MLEVELKAYDGPLDLLLSLIEKNRINIFDIPIVEITDQYLAYVKKLEEENLDVMSEFMVMAAELIAIKCRMLLPKEEENEEEEGDPREELVRRLLEYKTYKYMASQLRECMDGAAQHVFKDETVPDEVKRFRPEVDPAELVAGITLEKLHEVYTMILRRQTDRIDPIRSRFGTIEREEVSLPDKLEYVAVFAEGRSRFSFGDLLTGRMSKTQVVVTFLAILELMLYGYIRAAQLTPDDDIEFERIDAVSLDTVRERFGSSDVEAEGAQG